MAGDHSPSSIPIPDEACRALAQAGMVISDGQWEGEDEWGTDDYGDPILLHEGLTQRDRDHWIKVHREHLGRGTGRGGRAVAFSPRSRRMGRSGSSPRALPTLCAGRSGSGGPDVSRLEQSVYFLAGIGTTVLAIVALMWWGDRQDRMRPIRQETGHA